MTAKEAWEKWAEKRERETVYRRDRDGNNEWFFCQGFLAAQEQTGASSARSTTSETPVVRLG